MEAQKFQIRPLQDSSRPTWSASKDSFQSNTGDPNSGQMNGSYPADDILAGQKRRRRNEQVILGYQSLPIPVVIWVKLHRLPEHRSVTGVTVIAHYYLGTHHASQTPPK